MNKGLRGFASLRTRPSIPQTPRKVRRCLLCGSVLRAGNGGAFCRPCLMPRGGSLKSLVPDWAATLVENLREGDPQFKTVAALCFDKLVWKGDPERLRRVIHQEVITRCAVELKMSQEELSEQLAKPRIPLLTVLAISRALGGES